MASIYACLWGNIQLVLSVDKGPFRAPIGYWPSPHSDSARIWGSNQVRSWSRSGWGGEKNHKCTVHRCSWISSYTVMHMVHCVFYGLLWPTHCAHTSFSVSTHVNFLTSCIVVSPCKCIFGAAGELIGVWRCFIPVTICMWCCGWNFSDNNDHHDMHLYFDTPFQCLS